MFESPLFVLFVIFLILKLTHVIDWSWWVVTAPLWGAVAFFFLITVPLAIIAGTKFK